MLKKISLLIATILISASVNAGSSGSCGEKITCKEGSKSRCTMTSGSTAVFQQATFLNLTSKTDLFLRDLYAYKSGSVNRVDCFYVQDDMPENWVAFKTTEIHNVIPRNSEEWVKRNELLYCDPDLNSCLLYILY